MYNIAIPNLLNGVSQQPPQVRFPTQCEEMVNGYASPTESLTKRYPTEVLQDFAGAVGETDGKGKLHIIDRGDGLEAYAVIVKNDGITAWDLVNNQSVAVNLPTGGNYNYLSGVSIARIEQDITLATVADYTFVCNRNKTISMTNDVITSRSPEAFVWVKTGNFGTTYTVTVEALDSNGVVVDTLTVTHRTFAGHDGGVHSDGYLNGSVTIDGETFPTHTLVIDTRLIAAQITVALNAAFAADTNFDDLTATRTDYGIHITLNTQNSGNVADFKVSVGDGISGNGLRVIGDETQAFEDLPVIAPDGMVTKIIGLPEVDEDDYYVRFVSNIATETGEGVWVETVAPGISYKLDPATMPHALIRTFNGSTPEFTFTPIDGSAGANNVFWDDRTVGDTLTNPVPSFVGAEISSIFSYQGRLGILSGEAVSISEAGNFFNFFRTTVTSLLDSDPIDVYSAYPQITKFRHGIPLGDRLILFSNKAQMVLTSPDSDLLTPKTVILEPAGQYEAVADCMPARVDQEIYFPFKRGDNYTGVRDMVVNLQDSSLIAAPEVTSHVPKYLTGTPKMMKVSPFDRTLVVQTDSDKSSLYVYKWFDQGNERVQSSWSRWTFPGVNIVSLGWYESRLILYIYLPESNLYGLRQIDLRENRTDTNSPITARLDNRRYFSDTSSGSISVAGVYLSDPSSSVLFRFGTAGATGSIELAGQIPPTTVNPGATVALPTLTGPSTSSGLFNIEQTILEQDYIRSYSVPVRVGSRFTASIQFEATRTLDDPGTRSFSLRLKTNEGVYLINVFDLRFSTTVVGDSYASGQRAEFYVGGFKYGLEFVFTWDEPDTAGPNGPAVWGLDLQATVTVLDGPEHDTRVSAGFVTGCDSPLATNTTFAVNSCSTYVVYTNSSESPITVSPSETPTSPLIPDDSVVYASGTRAGQEVEVVSRTYNSGTGNTTLVLENTGGDPVFHGNPYEFRYQFSQPYFRVGTGQSALGAGRFQVRDMHVNYDGSGPFRAEVSSASPLINSSYTYHRGSTVNSSFVNSPLESGTMRIPVMGTTEQFNVSLINDTPYPSKFTSAEIQATYSGRYRRI